MGTKTYLLRVFTDENGNYGDVASIMIDQGRHIANAERQTIARELNTGETIFVNDLAAADISVVHPQGEIGFAGVGVVGTAWLLSKLRGKPTERMHSRDGEVTTWHAGDITWARGPLSEKSTSSSTIRGSTRSAPCSARGTQSSSSPNGSSMSAATSSSG